jgi:general secretion pathway protein A
MYNSYFHFTCHPFENTLDQRFMFMSEGHREVIAGLLYFVRGKKNFALVCGDVGTGKTMIVHHLLEKMPRTALPVLIPYPDVEFIEILRYLARVFKIETQGKDVLELTDGVKAALTKLSTEGKQVVLIIDEAHILPNSSLENIRLLSNIELAETKLLQILLIGQNELDFKLRKEGMRQLRQRINVTRVLPPMSPSETIEYIDHRLKIAGSGFRERFTPGCRKRIYKMTGGVPRSINRLCDTALLVCMIEKGNKVTEKNLKKAYDIINEDATLAPGARRIRSFSYAAFAYAKNFKTVSAAAALILIIALGVLGFKSNPGKRLKEWFHGTHTVQEVNTDVVKRQLPASEAKSGELPPLGPGQDRSSIGLPGVEDQSALASKLGAGRLIAREVLFFNKMYKDMLLQAKVSPPGVGAASHPAAPKEGQDLTAEKSGTRDTAPREPDKEAYKVKPYGEGSEKATAVRKPEDAVPPGPHAPERRSESSDYCIVTVLKGDKLSRIAARWFPEDPESGMKSILAANPQIHNKNLILTGQTLRIPKKKTGE